MLPYQHSIVSLSRPNDEEKNESISPVLAGGMVQLSTNVMDINSQVVEQDPAREPFKDTRRNSLGVVSIPLPVDAQIFGSAREQAGPDREEVSPAQNEDTGGKRNTLCTVPGHLPVDPGSASEQADPDGEEVPPAALGVIETELRQLKTQKSGYILSASKYPTFNSSGDTTESYKAGGHRKRGKSESSSSFEKKRKRSPLSSAYHALSNVAARLPFLVNSGLRRWRLFGACSSFPSPPHVNGKRAAAKVE
ncbi:hypothetical protein ARMGADRAFT_1040342 [Armillaria gallica]|uniref:Uncharacterized protein n=1 Tax=Armillaria gallica TaxID=47427 RepID=A0A2H3CVF0_ARMGA|nr:hypothetical protein ARMGADRAFT_1040342 [Armillaria gallica]